MKLTMEQLRNGARPKTNDLQKGDEVILRNGWRAVVADNQKGNIRICKVFGFCTETGSVYSHDITVYIAPPDEDGDRLMRAIDHTKSQLDLMKLVEDFG